ncbi:MAG: (2Fe-2S) ferredoxin domain-containing protein [Verrucomicrobiota bacterium]
MRIYICRECKKPKPDKIRGRARDGATLLRKLQEKDFGEVKFVPCKYLGKCKRGPNGMIRPGRVRVHRLTVKEVCRIAENLQ